LTDWYGFDSFWGAQGFGGQDFHIAPYCSTF
jgi:hypothetical protein